jgi:hypothetical protein
MADDARAFANPRMLWERAGTPALPRESSHGPFSWHALLTGTQEANCAKRSQFRRDQANTRCLARMSVERDDPEPILAKQSQFAVGEKSANCRVA